MAAISKHLEKAERLLQKGKLEPALEEFLIAWKEEPNNDAIVHTVADLYLRLNKIQECRQCYRFLFDKHAERGDSTEAVEMLQTLQKLGAVDPKRLVAMAQLVEKQKPDEAAQYYRQALEATAGQDAEIALQCSQGLAALQPSSIELQWRVATLALKLGKTALAGPAYSKVGDLLVAEKRYAEAIEALEQANRLLGNNPAVQLALAKACLKGGQFRRVVELVGKAEETSNDPQVLGLLADAYIADNQLEKAEGIYWKLVKTVPEAANPLMEIALGYLRRGNAAGGLRSVKQIEELLTANKRQKELTTFAEKLARISHSSLLMLEYLTRLLDQLHLDSPLAETLNSLFDLYFAAGEFRKAGEALERLIDIDPYAPECGAKLQRLEGKVDAAFRKELAARLGMASTGSDAVAGYGAESPAEEPSGEAPAKPAEGGNTLKDLILQAEIFLQYKLEDKARERLQRIAKLFPREEEKNEELRTLYERIKFSPQYAAAPAAATPAPAPDARTDMSRVSEIIRNLSRQGTVKGVLFTAVNDIGRLWQASRCVVGLATPARPPSMVLEYISPGISPSDAVALGRLVMGLQQVALEQKSTLAAEAVSETRPLAPLQTLLTGLQVQSLVAIPLRDGDQPTGILVLEQCSERRAWKPSDVAALEALGEQIVMAVANVRLRNLMKTLAVTDERSGLLHRDSYLPCLLSEAERMRTQKTPLTAALLQFSYPKVPGERRELPVNEFVQEFSATLVSHLRQNDMAMKYTPHALALILPGTTGKDAAVVMEKMRKLAASPSPTNPQGPPLLAAGIAEAVRDVEMDSADVVTELINRLEGVLEAAIKAGANVTRVQEPPAVPR